MQNDTSKIESKLTVLVIGFDGYLDVWNHDFMLMNRFWKNRPRTVLANQELIPNYEGVEILNAGKDAEWSKKVIEAIKQIDTEYILLLLEDFFISKPVDNSKLLQAVELMDKDKLDYYQVLVQLVKQSWTPGKPYKGNKHIRIIPKNKKYPINLQAAIWRKKYLKQALEEGNYNAWVFEMNHMYDSVNSDRVSCVIDDTNMLNITHGIVQSKYLRAAKSKLVRLGCNITDSERATLSFADDFKYKLKLFMYSLVPQCLQTHAKRIGKSMKIDFVTDRLNNDKK